MRPKRKLPWFPLAAFIGICAVTALTAQTAVSNLGQLTNSWAGIGQRFDGALFGRALGFTTGASPVDFTGVTLLLTVTPSASSPSGLQVSLNSGFGSSGSTGLLATLTGDPAPDPLGPTTFAYTAPAPISLAANSTYWIQVDAPTSPTDTFFAWTTTAVDNNSVDNGYLPGWSIGLSYYITNNGGASWSSSSFGGVNQFSLQYQTAVPEPAASAALVGLLAVGLVTFRRRQMRQRNQAD
jgi:MYXO-CTERM domain-containing protein